MVRFSLLVGLAFVFLYSGVMKLLHPLVWQASVPSWLSGVGGQSVHTWLIALATLEVMIGIACILPHVLFQRIGTFLGAALIPTLLITSGWTDAAPRDIALLCMTVAAWYSTAP